MNLAPDNSGRLPDGTFGMGNSVGAAGRPKGSRNRVTIAMEALLAGEAELVMAKAVEMALAGDSTALRLCLERLLPPVKDRPVSLDIPHMMNAQSISEAAEVILQASAGGEITPTEATKMMGLIEIRRKALETEELENRIDRLEQVRGQTH